MCFFLCFSEAGLNMVASRAKVDGPWQALSQRRLRYRVTGLRPSGLPNLPFSLFLPFPPFSSASLLFFPFFLQFSLFSPFPSFFPFFPQFPSNVLHEAQDTETNATCCERGFLSVSQHFWAHSKKGSNYWKTPQKEGFFLHFSVKKMFMK